MIAVLHWPQLSLPCADTPRAELPEAPDDAALVIAARSGAPRAFDTLVERYAPRLYRHLARMMGDAEEAEDLVQETFVKVYRALGHFDTRRDFRAWIYTIANNGARNALRSRARRMRFVAVSPEELVHAPTAGAPPAEDILHAQERQEQMERLLLRLPPMSRALIDLHYREGMSIREAAAVVGTSEGAAKVALHRARQLLRNRWATEHEA